LGVLVAYESVGLEVVAEELRPRGHFQARFRWFPRWLERVGRCLG
jgi:hypothetical protein